MWVSNHVEFRPTSHCTAILRVFLGQCVLSAVLAPPGGLEGPWTLAEGRALCIYDGPIHLGRVLDSTQIKIFPPDVMKRLEPLVFLGLSGAASPVKLDSGVQPGRAKRDCLPIPGTQGSGVP